MHNQKVLQHQKISHFYTTPTITHFTNILREIKSSRGRNSAEVIEEAIHHWKLHPTKQIRDADESRHHLVARPIYSHPSRVFYLQMLTSSESMSRLTMMLDSLRTDHNLKNAICTYQPTGFFDPISCRGGTPEFQLAALILLLENLKTAPIRTQHPLEVATPPLPSQSRLCRGQSVTNFNCNVADERRNVRAVSLDHQKNEPDPDLPHRHLLSWRSRIRDLQLAENRRMNATIRKSCGRESLSDLSPLTKRKYFRQSSPLTSNLMINAYSGNGSNPNANVRRQLEQHDNREFQWTVVHQVDIERKRSIDTENIDPNASSDSSMNLEKDNKYQIMLDSCTSEGLTFKARKERADALSSGYLEIFTPDQRTIPGFNTPMTTQQRLRQGYDCDEVFPRIILGNGATLRKKDYLKRIAITHILNAAEFRGVNVDQNFFENDFKYMGIRVEDTPQTQICR